jgi:hypothetical protein
VDDLLAVGVGDRLGDGEDVGQEGEAFGEGLALAMSSARERPETSFIA